MSIASAKKIYEIFGYHDIIFTCRVFTNDYLKKWSLQKLLPPLDNLTQKVYNIPIAETSAKNISQSVRVRAHYPG